MPVVMLVALLLGSIVGVALISVVAAAVWQAVSWPSDRPPLPSWEHCVQPQM